MFGRWIVGVVAMLVGAAALQAQSSRPLIPQPEEGNRVAPFFDGWYENPDGTVTLSFGYSNMNKETVEIPLGPDNVIVPKEYDGRQPTVFHVVAADPDTDAGAGAGTGTAAAAGGGAGGGAGPAAGGRRARRPNINRHDRQRGVFIVTVPGGFKDDVVWTLRYAGQTWSIPGRSKSQAYQLSWPMAMGSTPPLLRFQQAGPAGRGPMGIQGPDLQAKVGTPLDLTVWVTDDADHEKEPIKVKREAVPAMNVTWFKHSGPTGAPITFTPPKEEIAATEGKAATTATFTGPGDYLIRVRADTFGNIDSSPGDQCCWTNGYVRVAVRR